MASDPQDVNTMFSEMAVMALGFHEMFVEFQKAGFTRDDALDLIVKLTRS